VPAERAVTTSPPGITTRLTAGSVCRIRLRSQRQEEPEGRIGFIRGRADEQSCSLSALVLARDGECASATPATA